MSSSAIRIDLLVACALVIAIPAGAQPKGEDESAALVDEGRAALKKGALDDAAKALDQAIALNPRRVDAYVLRSAVFAARKQYRQGIELMKRAQLLAPADEDVLTALGSQLVLSGDIAGGVPLLVQVTQKNPARYDAQLLLAHEAYEHAKWGDAIGAFEAYFKSRPKALAGEDASHRVELGDAYLRARQPKQAVAEFSRAMDPKRPGAELRARIGLAWATAAIDCHKARPLLEKLAPIAEVHPEVWLVDGQCALALGDASGALALGRKYLDKTPNGSAAGHALVGEAFAARGNLADARKELETARQLEPTRRRWPVRLAVVLRRAGDHAGAIVALEKIGEPDKPGNDPDWWIELGETMLAKGDASAAATRLAPIAGELPEIRTVLGAAQLASGQAEAAVKTLGDVPRVEESPRARKLLVDALATVAASKLATDPAAAEPLLVRADALVGDGNGTAVWRNLGIARLALGKPADAVAVLDRAAKADGTAISQMLAARARAQTGDVAGARALYDKALALEKDPAADVEIAIDWAASELAGGDPAIAVTTLEKVQLKGVGDKLAQRHRAALAQARHAAGVAALKAGNGARAVELLRASATVDSALATRCDLALATVVAGDPVTANGALRAVSGQSCPFPPPADVQAVPILIAFTEGLSPRRAGKAVDKLTALAGKSTGPAAALLNTSLRVVALEAARDAYGSGQAAQSRKYLTTAKLANARVGNDEVALDLAVLDLAEGRTDAAIAQLEKLATKLPEALVNLGIAYDKKGEPLKALDAWKRARKAGSHWPGLTEWIESKERVYGGEP